jgi:hypothetical protein
MLSFKNSVKLQRRRQDSKKVVVTDLLAWNNETMLVHCFRHRLSQNNVTFSVSDLLTGQKPHFKNAGMYETSCKKLLEECCDCYEGHVKVVFDYIRLAT